jgi:type I restriction enzyme S subunit
MLEDLKAYRSAIISEAVTKGLDKNVEMKDSGVEWIGMIPKHWNINKLKFFADISTGTTPSTDNEEYWKEPTENWYTPSDFCEENVHLETSSRKVSTTAFQESACRVFKKDVVLVVGIGATLGKIGISSVECSANQQINAIEFYDNVYPLFGAYYLSSLKEVMKSLASAATLAIMNQSVTGSIPFVCPTLDEQKGIADYLEKKTKSIGSLLNQIEVQIDELKSYKSVLITEAVTGKIDLREWKPKEENV